MRTDAVLVDIYEAIRSEVDLLIRCRLKFNIDDFGKTGLTRLNPVHVIKVLEEKGLDLVGTIGGSAKNRHDGTKKPKGFFKDHQRSCYEIKIPLAITWRLVFKGDGRRHQP